MNNRSIVVVVILAPLMISIVGRCLLFVALICTGMFSEKQTYESNIVFQRHLNNQSRTRSHLRNRTHHIIVEDNGLLERLAFKYGTDKSKDDHKYVDVYSSIFDSRRFTIFNMTEIGISAGQSMQVWHEYFPHAIIYGIEFRLLAPETAAMLRRLHRVVPCHFDGQREESIKANQFLVESMDLIIDDGLHDRDSQERVLKVWWPYVKPGGYYIIEDISDFIGFEEDPSKLAEVTRSIFRDNMVYFVDAAVGHRDWDTWLDRVRSFGITSHRVHNSYMIIIRKRVGPIPPSHVNFGVEAMNAKKLVH